LDKRPNKSTTLRNLNFKFRLALAENITFERKTKAMNFLRCAFIFLLLPVVLIAQPRFEIQEFTGIVKSFRPGYRFALAHLIVDVDGKEEGFSFYAYHASLIMENLKIGDEVTIKANVDIHLKSLAKELDEKNKLLSWYLFFNYITELKVNDKWIVLPEKKTNERSMEYKVFLDKKVVAEYWQNGFRSGLVFENGLVAYNDVIIKELYRMESINPNDVVSFGGLRMGPTEGYVYPIEGVKEVYHFSEMTKTSATPYSYLFKQNFVCIGVKFKTRDGKTFNVSFPSNEAKRVKAFLKDAESVHVYYDNYFSVKGQLHPPELHALTKPSDTLYINQFGFYGGADVEHEHKDVEIAGKITKVNKSENGKLTGIMVGLECFVEVHHQVALQLGLSLKKGEEITVIGKERIKIDGEIYQRDYRIITPEKFVISGKEFSLFQP
jgi:hypothetical protein